MGQTLEDYHIEAKKHLKIGSTYLYYNEPVELLDFEDELTCSIIIDQKSCRTVPNDNFLNKIYTLINWPLDEEIEHYTYKRTVYCSYYMLEEIKDHSENEKK